MKTLDELITRFETAKSYLPEVEPGMMLREDDFLDALMYLKMYRSDKAQYEIDCEQWETAGAEARKAYEEARDRHIEALNVLQAEKERYAEAVKACEDAKNKYNAIHNDWLHMKWLKESEDGDSPNRYSPREEDKEKA